MNIISYICEITKCFSDINIYRICNLFTDKDFSTILNNYKYIDRGQFKKCYFNDGNVYKVMICPNDKFIRTLQYFLFFNLFLKDSFNSDLFYVKDLGNQYVYVIFKQKYVKFLNVKINIVNNFFKKNGMILYTEKTLYRSNFLKNDFNLSYSLKFDEDIILEKLDFRRYDIEDIKNEYKTYLHIIKQRTKSSQIIFSDLKNTNMTLDENNNIFIYDLDIQLI